MGVWIETSEENGRIIKVEVTPFVGVWIETCITAEFHLLVEVTPFVGVWIETVLYNLGLRRGQSHPSWVCGLKHDEISELLDWLRHTLRGCVD